MNLYYCSYNVEPLPDNPHAARVEGGVAHLVVADTEARSIGQRAVAYLKQYKWNAVSPCTAPVALSIEQFQQWDKAAYAAQQALQHGIGMFLEGGVRKEFPLDGGIECFRL